MHGKTSHTFHSNFLCVQGETVERSVFMNATGYNAVQSLASLFNTMLNHNNSGPMVWLRIARCNEHTCLRRKLVGFLNGTMEGVVHGKLQVKSRMSMSVVLRETLSVRGNWLDVRRDAIFLEHKMIFCGGTKTAPNSSNTGKKHQQDQQAAKEAARATETRRPRRRGHKGLFVLSLAFSRGNSVVFLILGSYSIAKLFLTFGKVKSGKGGFFNGQRPKQSETNQQEKRETKATPKTTATASNSSKK